jgi:protein-disulfide isomerase
MGLFSATHRELAKDAFSCVFLKATFQPCDTGLDSKIKTHIVSAFMKWNKPLGKIVFAHFEVFSWIFVILTVASLFFSVQGGVNYYLYGNCNGLDSDDFCVFDPTGENSKTSSLSSGCVPVKKDASLIDFSQLNYSLYPKLSYPDATKEMLFVGCYSCKYTREVVSTVMDLAKANRVNVTFAHLPIHDRMEEVITIGNCIYSQSPSLYWEFFEGMFALDESRVLNISAVTNLVSDLGLNVSDVLTCTEKTESLYLLDDQLNGLGLSGVYGTPTILIDDTVIVGPKPDRVYERLLRQG